MHQHYDLIGVGIGLFNLSLAALLDREKAVRSCFFDLKRNFDWHAEIMFADSDMQTSFLKDLVTAADPTSPHTFINYLVQKGLFYSFINTNRQVITRREFELYCQWVGGNLKEHLRFNSPILSIDYDKEKFMIKTDKETFTSDHVCLGTGLTARIPAFAEKFVGPKVFHAKSPYLKDLDITGKNIVVIGGGQTGIEVFRNSLKGKWGHARSVRLISSRPNLEPLDNSPFVNEYFAPGYVNEFFDLDQKAKDPIVQHQKLASDGNTPAYLDDLYRDLYQIKYVNKDERTIQILPYRRLSVLEPLGDAYKLHVVNNFSKTEEFYDADVIVLCTGFKTEIPKAIEPIRHLVKLDSEGRFVMTKNFTVQWEHGEKNKIYAMNFSRHGHGIFEPQTSLMAWRSASIINDLTQRNAYPQDHIVPNFVTYSHG